MKNKYLITYKCQSLFLKQTLTEPAHRIFLSRLKPFANIDIFTTFAKILLSFFKILFHPFIKAYNCRTPIKVENPQIHKRDRVSSI